MWSVVILIVGLALLVWGADHFVRGASTLAKKMGVPPLIVGLTIVALGTSAPELAVSVTAGLNASNEIAVGNVLGSNIFNLLMVAGGSALLCPLVMDRELLKRDWPLSIVATVLLGGLALWNNDVSRLDGIILLVFFVGVLFSQVRSAMKSRAAKKAEPLSEEESSQYFFKPKWIVFDMVIGLAAIVLGGQFSVNGATGIAEMLGLSETVIALTVVAIGTSLPELVTSLAAARRGENDIAMGNVIGSNLFNILFILGTSASITPIPLQPTAIVDISIVLGISLLMLIPALKNKFGRLVGLTSVLAYVGYTAFILIR